MEAIFFAIDVVGVLLLLYWAIINDMRKPGTPTTGLFAYRETIKSPRAEDAPRRPSPPSRQGR